MGAALYASRANLRVVLFEGGTPGGQIALTHDVENYPGLGVDAPISGPEIADKFQRHAERFGAEVRWAQVSSLSGEAGGFTLETPDGPVSSATVILGVGSSPRALGVPGEAEFMGRGVSTCATCDGAFFRDREVVVVGGGNSALEEGAFLTRFASKVTVVHRRQGFRATPLIVERARSNPKMAWELDQVVEAVLGDDTVAGVRVRHVPTGEQRDLGADGVFVLIGHDPNTGFLQGFVDLDEDGYVVVDPGQATSREGVWAAGDCADPRYKQLVTSAGDGVKAALNAIHWLEERG